MKGKVSEIKEIDIKIQLKMGIFEKFKIGLSKSSKNLSEGFKNFVINKKIDSKTLDNLEDFLIESDVGVVAAKELKQIFADTKIDPKKDSLDQVNFCLLYTSPSPRDQA